MCLNLIKICDDHVSKCTYDLSDISVTLYLYSLILNTRICFKNTGLQSIATNIYILESPVGKSILFVEVRLHSVQLLLLVLVPTGLTGAGLHLWLSVIP